MVSDEYWKDKTVGRREVMFAWAIIALLAVGAHYVDLAHRASACDLAGARQLSASIDDAGLTRATSRNPR
jgi:hypothetical protein